MARYSVLIFFIFLEILEIVSSASMNNSFDPFSPKLNKKSEVKGTDLPEEKEFFFDNDDTLSKEKLIAKRRLFFNEDDVNHALPSSENAELARRKTNYSESQTENQVSEYQQDFNNNWQNRQNRFYPPITNPRYNSEFRPNQPWLGQRNIQQNFNWEQKNDVFEKSQTHWNEEKNFKQVSNPMYDPRPSPNYNGGRPAGIFNDGPNVNIYPNRKISITTFDGPEMINEKKFNDGRDSEMNSGYLAHPSSNYYNRNIKGSWNPNFYRPEKGVIINFNTDCVPPRQFNNQLMQKVFYSPKSPLNAQPEIRTYQIPETSVISTQKISPMYYL